IFRQSQEPDTLCRRRQWQKVTGCLPIWVSQETRGARLSTMCSRSRLTPVLRVAGEPRIRLVSRDWLEVPVLRKMVFSWLRAVCTEILHRRAISLGLLPRATIAAACRSEE